MQKKPRIYYIETQHNLPNSYGEGTNLGGATKGKEILLKYNYFFIPFLCTAGRETRQQRRIKAKCFIEANGS